MKALLKTWKVLEQDTKAGAFRAYRGDQYLGVLRQLGGDPLWLLKHDDNIELLTDAQLDDLVDRTSSYYPEYEAVFLSEHR